MVEETTTSELVDKSAKSLSPKLSSPRLGKKSSWKEINALLKSSQALTSLGTDFSFGLPSPRKSSSKLIPPPHPPANSPQVHLGNGHGATSDTDDSHATLRTDSMDSIEWNKSDASVLTTGSYDTNTSSNNNNTSGNRGVFFDEGFNVIVEPEKNNMAGVAFAGSFDENDIPLVETEGMDGDQKDEGAADEPQLKPRGNWLGGESLSSNKLAMLLNDMQGQLSGGGSRNSSAGSNKTPAAAPPALSATEKEYLRKLRLKEGETLKIQLASCGDSVPRACKTLKGAKPKTTSAPKAPLPSYEDSKSVTSTVSANSTRSRGGKPSSARGAATASSPARNSKPSNLTVENLAKKNAAAAQTSTAAKSKDSPKEVPSYMREKSPGRGTAAATPERGRPTTTTPERGRSTSSPQRVSRTAPAGSTRDASAQRTPSARDASVQRLSTVREASTTRRASTGTAAASSTSKIPTSSSSVRQSTGSVKPAPGALRSTTPNARTSGAVSAAESTRRSASAQPASRTSSAGRTSSSTMGTGGRSCTQPIQKERLAVVVEKAPIPKTPVKKVDSTNRFASPDKKGAAAANGAAAAAAATAGDKTLGRKQSLKAPTPSLATLKATAPAKKGPPPAINTAATPAKGGAANPLTPGATPTPKTPGTAGAPTPKRASFGGTVKKGDAAGADAAAAGGEKKFVPPGGVAYVPEQPEIYIPVLTHSTPLAIASMYTRAVGASNNRYVPPSNDALELLIKNVMARAKGELPPEDAPAVAVSGGSGGGGRALTPEKAEPISPPAPAAGNGRLRLAAFGSYRRSNSVEKNTVTAVDVMSDISTDHLDTKAPTPSRRSLGLGKPKFSTVLK